VVSEPQNYELDPVETELLTCRDRIRRALEDAPLTVPGSMTVKTTCDRLGIDFCEPEEFTEWVRRRLASL
jgi:hypothetical protein